MVPMSSNILVPRPCRVTGHRASRSPSGRRRVLHCVLFLALVPIAGCGVEEVIREAFRGETPRERYIESLGQAGLADAELTRRWIGLSEVVLRAPLSTSLPHLEAGRFEASEPTALSWRFELQRGERVTVSLSLDPSPALAPSGSTAPTPKVFLELYRLRDPDDPDADPLLVASPEPTVDTVAYEARSSADYLLRIQPELLVEGDFEVEIRTGPSLAFPVEGHGTGHIQSVFGDPRDGGRREHHGVDIFSPRGTPVLAVSTGRVTRVRETPVGGKVVWVRDDAWGISQYYAHLDSQEVTSGTDVQPGDTLGFVGNTGNAISTPPHLHFGLYMRGEGPVDPWYFLHDAGGSPAELRASPSDFRSRGWTTGPEVRIRESPSASAASTEDPEGPSTGLQRSGDNAAPPLRVLSATGAWLRVRIPDGRHGYLSHADFQAFDEGEPQ
ncbi:MAG: M23 family metallopeptidase [Gemmatimonadales bacterium]|nr:MAG: M23 family metallopeptidase [Gemmatimonadales bacterium]